MAIPFRGATLSSTCSTECDLADPNYGQFAVSPGSHLAAEWVIGRLEWLVVVLGESPGVHSLFPIANIAET